jgi:aspartyl-tRNA(Asn)/glutamyl-tRNA(Gln) amidotransferase subunit B
MRWDAVIGLEIHAQLRTHTKLFCGCPTEFRAPPNTQVCPVCLGHPGVLPCVNRRAVELALRIGLALGAKIHPVSAFARKNYFYPDLPKNYQITQYRHPLCEGGSLRISAAGNVREIRIARVHLEEDAGKSRHPDGTCPRTRIDLNRCGIPLVEIVSEPDIRTPAEAHDFLRLVRRLLMWLDACDGNMEEGSLRCDANVSLRPTGTEGYGVRTELKNLNSMRFLRQSLAFEIDRQVTLLDRGGTVLQETRLWDETAGCTAPMRGKEEVHDYRYFPEPDLPPLHVDKAWIESIRGRLPELPDRCGERLRRDHGLSAEEAEMLTATREAAEYYERVAAAGVEAKMASTWIANELLPRWKTHGSDLEPPVAPESFAFLIREITSGRLSRRQAREVLDAAVAEREEPERIVRRLGLSQVSDSQRIADWIEEVLREHPDQIASYFAGRSALLHFFVGRVMERSGGKANPSVVDRLLREELEKRRDS